MYSLSFSTDGVVTVTVEGNTIITYNDPQPIEVNYLGFGTFYNNDVHFYYNCTKAGNDGAIETVPSHGNA